MSILICHMFDNHQTLYSMNLNIKNSSLLCDLFLQNIYLYKKQYFWRTICLSVIIKFYLIFYRFIGKCCMLSIFSYRTKISINYIEQVFYLDLNPLPIPTQMFITCQGNISRSQPMETSKIIICKLILENVQEFYQVLLNVIFNCILLHVVEIYTSLMI